MQYNNCHNLSNWSLCDTAQCNLPSKGPHHIFGSSTLKFFFFLCFEHTTHLPWHFDFSVLGATFLRKYLSVNRGTVLLGTCHPSTLCVPAARAYFVNKLSTSSILYESCCIFLPSVATQSVDCSIFSFLANSVLLKKLSSHKQGFQKFQYYSYCFGGVWNNQTWL